MSESDLVLSAATHGFAEMGRTSPGLAGGFPIV